LDKPFNRRDIGYFVISRFEEAFRSFLSDKLQVFFGNYLDGIADDIVRRTKDRTEKTDWDNLSDFLEDIDFPDLKQIVCKKGMFPKYFPNIDVSKDKFQLYMDELYNLRCKIAHIRNYFTSLDLDKLFELTGIIASHFENYSEDFKKTINILKEHPEDVVIPIPPDFICDDFETIGILNNIPIPDYEYEGGFVGRTEDIKKIISLIRARQVVTISGAGGVGKTALALRIIQELSNKEPDLFDGIIWMSAKEARLSYLGIEDIEPTIKDYEELLYIIAEVMGFGDIRKPILEREEDVKTIFELCDCILIVIDNLETISDERIINFVLDAHPKIKILITSRKGLGQVERRYNLKQLKEKEAIYLFRQVARDKNLDSLARLDDNTISSYVKKVACYPLAIKWIIGHAAIGEDINIVIKSIDETKSDISLFCFEQIFNSLSNDAKKIICALSVFDDPPAAGVLKYVVELPQDNFVDGIRDLILVSLIIPESYETEKHEIISQYSLLSLTRGYVRQQLDKDTILKRDIEERLRTVQSTIEEATRAKKGYRFTLANLGATTEAEKIAAVIALTAWQKYQAGNYLDAVEEYKRAISIAPGFSALYRNWAVVESQEYHHKETDDLMAEAAKLNPSDPLIWLTWGNIKRKGDRIQEAEKYYNKAYKLSPNDPVILNSLGQAKCRLGEHAEADKLFRGALQKKVSGSSIRHEIINYSSIADNLRRWAEALIKDRNYEEAEKKLFEAHKNITKVVELNKRDTKSQDLMRRILINLGFFYKGAGDSQKALKYFTDAFVDNAWSYKQKRDKIISAFQIIKIYFKEGNLDMANKYITNDLFKMLKSPDLKKELYVYKKLIEKKRDFQKGKIINVDPIRGYTIIESLSTPRNTYLGHISCFLKNLDLSSVNIIGNIVGFTREESETKGKSKKLAKNIIFL